MADRWIVSRTCRISASTSWNDACETYISIGFSDVHRRLCSRSAGSVPAPAPAPRRSEATLRFLSLVLEDSLAAAMERSFSSRRATNAGFVAFCHSNSSTSYGLERPATWRLAPMLCDLHVKEREHGKPLLLMTPHWRSKSIGPRFFFPPPIFLRRAWSGCGSWLAPDAGGAARSRLGETRPSAMPCTMAQLSRVSKVPHTLVKRIRFAQHRFLACFTCHNIHVVVQ